VHIAVRLLVAPAVLGLAFAVGSGVRAQQPPPAPFAPRVMMVDNNGSFSPGDPGTGQWSFAPAHITVTKGDKITFVNPASNFRPHAVTSITATGMAPTRTLESAKLFDSSPTREMLIMPGSSFELDTSSLDPGHYSYYCTLHPWMLGSFTVIAAPEVSG
jgi:plastocyanin